MNVSAKITEPIMKTLVNKSLEEYNTSLEKIWKDFPDGKPTKKRRWEDYYTWRDKESYETFKKWAVDYLSKELNITKEEALEEYQWFDLACGLAQPYLFITQKSPSN